MLTKISGVVVSLTLCGSAAFAFTPEQTTTINNYNSKYEELLLERVAWKLNSEGAKVEVNSLNLAYANSLASLETMSSGLALLEQEADTQAQHLAFLQQITSVANGLKSQARQAAVQAGFFTDVSQVNIQSLRAQASGLQTQVDGLNGQVAQKQQAIDSLEASAEFTGLVNQRSDIRRQLGAVESGITGQTRQIGLLEGDLVRLGADLSLSEQLEEQYRIEAVEIRTKLIPRQQTQQAQTQSNLSQKSARQAVLSGQLQGINRQLGRINERIEALEAQLVNDPDNQNLKDRLAERREARRLKRQERRPVRQELTQVEADVQSLGDRLGDISDELTRLFDLALQKDANSGDEAIQQIRLESQIGSADTNLSLARTELAGLQAQKSGLVAQRAQVQGQINLFVETNIRPIEAEISVLNQQVSGLNGQKTQLQSWAQDLQRQNQNIAQAPNNIATQEVSLQQAQAAVKQAKDFIGKAEQESQALKAQLTQATQAYNGQVQRLQALNVDLQNLENQLQLELSGGN